MTKKERIEQLERRVQELEAQIARIQADKYGPGPWWGIYPPFEWPPKITGGSVTTTAGDKMSLWN